MNAELRNAGASLAEAPAVIRAVAVRRVYGRAPAEVHALRELSLAIAPGEFVAIVGPSGSGKTTLFNTIGGLDRPTAGSVFIDQVDIAALDALELAWLRCHKVGYVFQTYNLITSATALENVLLPMLFAGTPRPEAQDRAVELLGRVGLGERLRHRPGELSGGQQQRVAIARALANGPSILLADEPTGNLDSATGAEIVQLLVDLNMRDGMTIVTATHDAALIAAAVRVLHLHDGHVVKEICAENAVLRRGLSGAKPGRAEPQLG